MAAITDYASLRTAITAQAFGNTTLDTALAVQLAEAKLNRRLKTRRQTTTATGSASAATFALPADFAGVRALRLTSAAGNYAKLEPVSLDRMDELKATSNVAGAPACYAIRGDAVELYPEPSQATPYQLSYYAKLPALASNSTNWLLADHPDVYLTACMVEVGLFLDDDAMLGKYEPVLLAVLDDLNAADQAESYGDRLSPQISNFA
jgi:hypothetical protein